MENERQEKKGREIEGKRREGRGTERMTEMEGENDEKEIREGKEQRQKIG